MSGEFRSGSQQCLQPLEYEDCLTDSPLFRENLKSHEKEIDNTSQSLKHLHTELKKLLSLEEELSKFHRQFANTVAQIGFKPIGDSTEDETEIEEAFRKFSSTIEEIEEQRMRCISGKNSSAMRRLENFRKVDIANCKEAKKKFHSHTDKSCSTLEKSLASKRNQKGLDDLDSSCYDERRNLFEGSLRYVALLHEVQEKKKFEVCEAILQIMYSWKIFYQMGYEMFKELQPYHDDLAKRLQNLQDTFESEKSRSEVLKEKVSKKLTQGSTSSSPDTRQGYLFSREKTSVGFGHSWMKYFCEYSRKQKTLTVTLYNQTQGRVGNSDQINVASVVKKRSEEVPRRFCFEVKSADEKVWTFQALSETDLKNWMEIMEGKEASYSEPMQTAKLRVPPDTGMEFVRMCIRRMGELGLREQGIYRVSGAQTKVNRLIAATFEEKKTAAVMEIDDIKVIASALKMYFREILPEPLLTFKLHESFLEAMKTEDRNQRIKNLTNVVSALPKTNYECLKMLIKHLNDIAALKEDNLMQESNLGVVFGPTLMRPREETVASIFMIKHQNSLVENLIIEYDAIFQGGEMNKKYSSMVQTRNSARMTKRPNFKQKAAPTPPLGTGGAGPAAAPAPAPTTSANNYAENPFDSSDDEPSPVTGGPPAPQQHLYVNRGPWPPPSAQPPQKPIKTIPRQRYTLSARVIYDCVADEPDELSFVVGDIITNIRDADEDGWVTGTCRGKTGLVPRNHLDLPKSNV